MVAEGYPMICASCRWWDRCPEEEWGLCRKGLPNDEGGWPATDEDDWCGEWTLSMEYARLKEEDDNG